MPAYSFQEKSPAYPLIFMLTKELVHFWLIIWICRIVCRLNCRLFLFLSESTWGSVSMLFSSTSNNWSCENITAATTTATSTVSLDDGGWTSPTSPSEFRRTRDPGATPIKIRNVAPPRPPPGGTPNGDGPWPPNIQLEDGLEWLPTLPNDTWKQCSWPRARQSCTLWWLLLRWPTFIRCSMWKW